MHILLRDDTGLFYAGRDSRTSSTRDAADFRDINIAAQLAADQRLPGAEVVLHYLQPPCQVSLPVRAEWFPCRRPEPRTLLQKPEDRLSLDDSLSLEKCTMQVDVSLVSERMVILLVEDLADDVLLVRRAFAEAKLDPALHVVGDGEEALDYLLGMGKYANRNDYPMPSLVLLDLKLPKMNGIEVLRWIRLQPNLKALRVIVLTSSEDIFDVNRAYEAGANSFLVKPLDFTNYPAMMGTLSRFWLTESKAPIIERPPEIKPTPGQNDASGLG